MTPKELPTSWKQLKKWPEIIGLRNFLVHEYFGVDEKIIWQIITVDIPELKKNLKSISL